MQRARARGPSTLTLGCPPGYPREEDEIVTPQAEVHLCLVAPALVYSSSTGVLTREVASFHIAYLSRQLPNERPLRVFSDLQAVRRIDPSYRDIMMGWMDTHRHEIGAVNLLVKSRLMAMAIAVGRLALGGIATPFHDAVTFEADLRAQIRT